MKVYDIIVGKLFDVAIIKENFRIKCALESSVSLSVVVVGCRKIGDEGGWREFSFFEGEGFGESGIGDFIGPRDYVDCVIREKYPSVGVSSISYDANLSDHKKTLVKRFGDVKSAT